MPLFNAPPSSDGHSGGGDSIIKGGVKKHKAHLNGQSPLHANNIHARILNNIGTKNKIVNHHYPPYPAPKVAQEEALFYNVPAPVKGFGESRQQFLEEIAYLLNNPEKDSPKMVNISGIQGIGKTQLAFKFANQHRLTYQDKCFWIEATTKAQINIAIEQLAHLCGIQESNVNFKVEAMYKQLNKLFPAVLLIFDNLVDISLIKFLPKPVFSNIHIIITTHNLNTNRYPGKLISLEVKDKTIQEDNLRYLRNQLNPQEDCALDFLSQCQQLVETLGHLPLAVTQAIYYIKEQNIAISDYLKLYQKEMERHHLLRKDVSDYEKTVLSIWRLSLKKLSSSTQRCIKACAYLEGESISRLLMSEGFFDGKENTLSAAITELTQYALLMPANSESSHHQGTYSMHDLIQEAARLDIELGCDDDNKKWLVWLITVVTNFLSSSVPAPFTDAVDSIRKSSVYRHNDGSGLTQLRKVIPHILSLLFHAGRLKIKETKDNFLKRHLGTLCYHLGLYYSNIAYDVSKAKKYLVEGLDYQKSITNQTGLIKEDIIKSYRQLFKVFLNNASMDTDKKRKDQYFKESFFYLQQFKKLSQEIGIYEKSKANFFMDCALYYFKFVKYFKNGQLEPRSSMSFWSSMDENIVGSDTDSLLKESSDDSFLDVNPRLLPSEVQCLPKKAAFLRSECETKSLRSQKVKFYLDKAKRFSADDNFFNHSRLYHYYGNYYFRQGEYPDALEAFSSALVLKLKRQEKSEIARTLARISRLYNKLFSTNHQPAHSNYYLKQAICTIRLAIYYQASFQASFLNIKIADNLKYLGELYNEIKSFPLYQISILAAYNIKYSLGHYDTKLENKAFEINVNSKEKVRAEEIKWYNHSNKKKTKGRGKILPASLRQETIDCSNLFEVLDFKDKYESYCTALELTPPENEEDVIIMLNKDKNQLQNKKPRMDIVTLLTSKNKYLFNRVNNVGFEIDNDINENVISDTKVEKQNTLSNRYGFHSSEALTDKPARNNHLKRKQNPTVSDEENGQPEKKYKSSSDSPPS